jgi:hypothetical protein
MNPYIYLHEIVKSPSGREDAYAASVLSLRYEPDRATRKDRHWALGQYKSIGIAGNWPCAINFWEHSWESQTNALRAQFQDSGRDTTLETWWNRNLHLRSGGFDRILLPAAYSPTRTELRPRFRQWKVYLHEIAWIPPGEPVRYLQKLEQEALPVAEQLGMHLAGAFRVAMRPGQTLTLLAADEWKTLANWLNALATDERLREWRRYREEVITRSEALMLLPVRHDPTGPRNEA